MTNLNERNLSVIVHSLFSSWMLAFLFEGQILYKLTDTNASIRSIMVFSGIAALFFGAFLCGFIIKTKKEAKRLFVFSYLFFIAMSIVFFFPLSLLWYFGIILCSFLAGCCVAGWGFFLKSGTVKNQRIKTVADMLIFSNVLMILLNVLAIHISPQIALVMSMLLLFIAFLFALKLPKDKDNISTILPKQPENSYGITKLLAFLCLFIVIITINSGLMYQVINPAFSHLQWLTSWYWAIPYIVALVIMRNLNKKVSRTYILYIALAMIGLSFIAFMSLERSVTGYLVVNTLMLGGCGVYDLFWWSILGEMLDFHKNPAKILGIGLSANLIGVLLGGIVGRLINSSELSGQNPTLLALSVVCVTFALLPPLNKYLSSMINDHTHLPVYCEMPGNEQKSQFDMASELANLTERERQVASLLLQAKTYRAIAGELFISENTVKYYVKNIYSKFKIQSRAELIDIMMQKSEK